MLHSNYATMRFEPEALHGANNGLNIARSLLEKIKAKYPWISYGDLWTLAGVCAVQVSHQLYMLGTFLNNLSIYRRCKARRSHGGLVASTASRRMRRQTVVFLTQLKVPITSVRYVYLTHSASEQSSHIIQSTRYSTVWGEQIKEAHIFIALSFFSLYSFNDQEIVALVGAHALGRCHPDR